MREKKQPVKPKSNTKYIFWCHTDLPEDFAFIFSTSELGARRKHASLSSIPLVHLIATKICPIPAPVLKELKIKRNCGIASDDLVNKAGIDFLTKDGSVFRYDGKVYQEMNLLEQHASDEGNQGPMLYLFKVKDRACYKIGFSTKVANRRKQIPGPEKIELKHFIKTPLARSLETRIKKQFRNFYVGKEFYELDTWGESLLITTYFLYFLEYNMSKKERAESDFFMEKLPVLIQLAAKHRLNAAPSAEDKVAFEALRLLVDARIEEAIQAFMNSLVPAHLYAK